MPLLGTRGAASARGFGFLGGAPQTASFIATLDSGSFSARAQSTAVDSSGNMYVGFGSDSGSGAYLAKYSTEGALVFQKQITVSGLTLSNSPSVTIDSSDVIYFVVGEQNSYTDPIIVRLDTSGNVVNARRITGGGFNPGGIRAAVFGTTLLIASSNSSNGVGIAGFNTASNTVSWSHRWASSTLGIYPLTFAESPNYYYMFGYTSTPNPFAMQLSKSGTVNLMRGSSLGGYLYGGATDSSDNLYMGITNTAQTTAYIDKYDASFTGVSRATASTSYINPNGFAKDASGNFYVSGQARYPVGGVNSGYIARFDTGLSFSFQRIMFISGRPTNQTLTYTANTVSRNSVFSVGYANDGALTYSNYISTSSVPVDGTKTGNYTVNRTDGGTYTYQYETFSNTWSVSGTPGSFSFGSNNTLSLSVTTVTASASNSSLSSVIKLM